MTLASKPATAGTPVAGWLLPCPDPPPKAQLEETETTKSWYRPADHTRTPALRPAWMCDPRRFVTVRASRGAITLRSPTSKAVCHCG
jgi:hypothetical protein